MRENETIDFTTKQRLYTYKGQPLHSMSGLDLSCNKLIGEILLQIGELSRIHTLNLSQQFDWRNPSDIFTHEASRKLGSFLQQLDVRNLVGEAGPQLK